MSNTAGGCAVCAAGDRHPTAMIPTEETAMIPTEDMA
jgi:hypothetical protein